MLLLSFLLFIIFLVAKLLFKFFKYVCSITFIILGSVYIVNYIQAVSEGLAVPNGLMLFIGSIVLVVVGLFMLVSSFRKKSSITESTN